MLLAQRRRLYPWASRQIVRFLTRTTVRGREHLPTEPALLVFNHIGHLDPVVIFSVLRHPPQIVALADLTRAPIAPFLFLYRPLLAHRGEVDRTLIDGILSTLAAGRQVLLAPEARISRSGALETARGGVAFVALQSGVPVVPIGLTGTERVAATWRRGRRPVISMNIGRPFRLRPDPTLSRRAQRQVATTRMMARLASLLPPAYRGVYADGILREE